MNFIMSIPMSSSSLSDQITPSLSQSLCFFLGGESGQDKESVLSIHSVTFCLLWHPKRTRCFFSSRQLPNGKRTYRIETHDNKIGINPWDRQNKYDSDYLGTCPTLRNIYFGTGQRSPAEIHWFIDLIFIRMCQRT